MTWNVYIVQRQCRARRLSVNGIVQFVFLLLILFHLFLFLTSILFFTHYNLRFFERFFILLPLQHDIKLTLFCNYPR